MSWDIPRLWEDSSCWIIGGGPSLAKVFGIPNRVVEQVRQGLSDISAYSPYLGQIHQEHVIGINMSYKLGTWVDMAFFADRGFYDKEKEGLHQFPNIKVTCAKGFKKALPGFKQVKRSPVKYGLCLDSNTISWNNNSGIAAINLAIHLGVKKVYLLGFDMKLDSAGNQHWHRAYGSRQIQRGLFAGHCTGLDDIAEKAAKLGVEIINVNPDSAINHFPKKSLQELQLKPFRVLAIATVFNEIKYLPDMVSYWKQQGVDVYYIDNMSNDGTWEWLQENNIASHRVDTGGAFDLRLLQAEIIKTLRKEKPDWFIYSSADLYYVFPIGLLRTISEAQFTGHNQIALKCFSAKNTGEVPGLPLPLHYHHGVIGKTPFIMISKYHPELSMQGDFIKIPEPVVLQGAGVMVNYGDCKPKVERLETFNRRKKAWQKGEPKSHGSHYREGDKVGWLFEQDGLLDLRESPYKPLVAKIKRYLTARTKVAVIIPTCDPNRRGFLELQLSRLSRQTRTPDMLILKDESNFTNKPDLTKRYRLGCDEAFRAGMDLVIFMEDDDYYPLTYVEELTKAWEISGKPALIGHGRTRYYYLLKNHYHIFKQLEHCSAHCSAVSSDVNLNVCPDDYLYFDIKLWQGNEDKVQVLLKGFPVSIKHNIGMSAGHTHKIPKETNDPERNTLRSWVDDECFEFYQTIQTVEQYESGS